MWLMYSLAPQIRLGRAWELLGITSDSGCGVREACRMRYQWCSHFVRRGEDLHIRQNTGVALLQCFCKSGHFSVILFPFWDFSRPIQLWFFLFEESLMSIYAGRSNPSVIAYRHWILAEIDYKQMSYKAISVLSPSHARKLTCFGILQAFLAAPSFAPEPGPVQSIDRQNILHGVRQVLVQICQ